jgi:hypothetical protein
MIASLTQELGTKQFTKNLARTPKSPLPVEILSFRIWVNRVRGVNKQFKWVKTTTIHEVQTLTYQTSRSVFSLDSGNHAHLFLYYK